MIEPTDEMREAFERAFEFATSDEEVVINRRAIRAGLAAVLAIVERDQAGPCSAVIPRLVGVGEIWCMLRHGHAGDHFAENGLTRWKDRLRCARIDCDHKYCGGRS